MDFIYKIFIKEIKCRVSVSRSWSRDKVGYNEKELKFNLFKINNYLRLIILEIYCLVKYFYLIIYYGEVDEIIGFNL